MRIFQFAGSFYPASEKKLKEDVEKYLEFGRKIAKSSLNYYGGISPHAGYVFSGKVAGVTYAALEERIKKAETAIIIGPNHTGLGTPVALSLQNWETPLGEIEYDEELAKLIQKESQYIDFNEDAHRKEHSIEVQLPFLQVIKPEIKIVAIAMLDQSFDFAEDVGTAIFKAVDNEKVVVIATTDLNHYVPISKAKILDGLAIEAIKTGNPKKFLEIIEKNNLSLCGYGPVAALMVYAKLSDYKMKFLYYANSGEAKVFGYDPEYEGVVGYGSFVIEKK